MDGQMFQGQTSTRVETSMFCTFIEKKNNLYHTCRLRFTETSPTFETKVDEITGNWRT